MNRQLGRTGAGQIRAPYDFNRSILFPFKSGPNSVAFVFKSAALYALITTVLMFVFGKWIVGAFMEFMTFIEALDVESTEPEFSEVMKMFSYLGKMMLPFLLVSLIGWFVMIMIEAAFYRRVFFGENKSIPWRFGHDEILVMLSQLIFGLVMFGLMAVFYAIIGLAILAMGVGSVPGGEVNALMAVLGGLVMFVSFIGLFVAMIMISVRFSPIAALSVSRGRLTVKETWQVTKGRFWPIVGSFVIVAVLASIVNYVLQMILMVGMIGSAGSMADEFENIEEADPDVIISTIMDIVTKPTFLIVLAIAIFIYTAVQIGVRLLYSGVVANAVDLYREDLGENDLEVFD